MRVDIDESANEEVKKAKKSSKTENATDETLASSVDSTPSIETDKANKTTNNKEANTKKSNKSTDKSAKNSDDGTEKKTTSSKKDSTVTTTKAATKTPKKSKTIKVDVLDEEPPISKKSNEMKLPVVRKIHIKIGYFVLACFLIVFGVFFTKVALWEHNYLIAKEGSERATVETEDASGVYETNDGEEVDESVPSEAEVQAYIVAPDKPRFISIPSIGVRNSRVREINVAGNGELGTPTNINDTGWYVGSSLPGEYGTSVMDGHGGALGYGVYRNLPKVKVGDKITVEMGDGRLLTYRVADIAIKNIGDEANDYMTTAFSSPDGSSSSLTVITCTGDWWQRQRTYSQRMFVRAVLE